MHSRRLERVVGFGVLSFAAAAGGLLWLAVTVADPRPGGLSERVILGIWRVFYSTQAPSMTEVATAAAIALLLSDWVRGRNRRAESRSIYPDGWVPDGEDTASGALPGPGASPSPPRS